MPAPPRLVVLVALPLLWLTACSDSDAEPDPEPASTATEATLEPEPSEPSIPAAAQGTDEASAKAFVRYWFELLSEAMTTGDTDLVRALSSPDCQTCASLVDVIQDTFAEGGHAESEGWTILHAQAIRGAKEMTFDLEVRMGPERFYDGEGELVHDFRGDRSRRMIAVLVPHQASWRLLRLDVEA